MLWVGQSLCLFLFLQGGHGLLILNEFLKIMSEKIAWYVKALQKYGTSVSKHQSADCPWNNCGICNSFHSDCAEEKNCQNNHCGKTSRKFLFQLWSRLCFAKPGWQSCRGPSDGRVAAHPRSSLWVFDVCPSLQGGTITTAACPGCWKGRTLTTRTPGRSSAVLSPLASWRQGTRAPPAQGTRAGEGKCHQAPICAMKLETGAWQKASERQNRQTGISLILSELWPQFLDFCDLARI